MNILEGERETPTEVTPDRLLPLAVAVGRVGPNQDESDDEGEEE